MYALTFKEYDEYKICIGQLRKKRKNLAVLIICAWKQNINLINISRD